MIDRPSHSGDHVRPLPGYPGVGINVNGEPGSCSLDEAARIMRALRGVVGQELACLANVHPADAVALANALAMSPLDISCGNRCCLADGRCSNANTTLPGSWRSLLDGGETMSLQMSKLRTDEALRENLMHELLHYAGVDHPEGPDGHGGTDEVYSCGRYCNRCTHNSRGAGQDMLDCLRCADPAHKTKCGSYYEIEQQPPYAPAICHGGIGANASCNKWVVEVIKACTGDVLARGAQCCAECPESTPNNDFPCNFPMPPPLQHCMPTDKPFGC